MSAYSFCNCSIVTIAAGEVAVVPDVDDTGGLCRLLVRTGMIGRGAAEELSSRGFDGGESTSKHEISVKRK